MLLDPTTALGRVLRTVLQVVAALGAAVPAFLTALGAGGVELSTPGVIALCGAVVVGVTAFQNALES